MRKTVTLGLGCVVFVLLLAPRMAEAQYKNTTWGVDAGFQLSTEPPMVDENGTVLPFDRLPLRLSNGIRIGIENNYKMSDDHWWFQGRAHTSFLRYGGNTDYDKAANEAMGTIIGAQVGAGLRYFFLTDTLRPYVGAAMSYVRLFTFTGSVDSACSIPFDTGVVPNASCGTAYLPHPNVLAVHVEPGFEWVFTRDIALRFFADFQRWILINADDNHGVVFGIGMSFFI